MCPRKRSCARTIGSDDVWRARSCCLRPTTKRSSSACSRRSRRSTRGLRPPQVYESLYAIHAAQARSVRLMRRDEPPYGVDVLGIAIEKGGASVLADGYLVAGSLTLPQARLLFGLGALLQLGDDLQDVEDDRAKGLATIFSQTAQPLAARSAHESPLPLPRRRARAPRVPRRAGGGAAGRPDAESDIPPHPRRGREHSASLFGRVHQGARGALAVPVPRAGSSTTAAQRERTSAFALLATAMSAGTPTSST